LLVVTIFLLAITTNITHSGATNRLIDEAYCSQWMISQQLFACICVSYFMKNGYTQHTFEMLTSYTSGYHLPPSGSGVARKFRSKSLPHEARVIQWLHIYTHSIVTRRSRGMGERGP